MSSLTPYGPEVLQRQREALLPRKLPADLLPIRSWRQAGSAEEIARGSALIAAGAVGCLLLAGGQGTRFGYDAPKGTYPVTLFKKKSLFQFFCEKVRAASLAAGRPLPLAIMTSPLNHDATLSFFNAHRFFGLSPSQVGFFCQHCLPFLDDAGEWIEEKPGTWAEGPSGNGVALHLLRASPIWTAWRSSGVEWVSTVLIDNPLADPFDAALIGHCAEQRADAALKGVLRDDPLEAVGLIGECGGHVRVIEYSELPQDQLLARNGDGSLRWPLANISLFCFHAPFIERLQKEPPLHAARKAYGSCMVWKCEAFIFDVLEEAERVSVLVYPREQTYAPLKNASGPFSLKSVQEALVRADRRTYAHVSGLPPPERLFELDPAFSYPTADLAAKWRGRPLPSTDYVEA
jgi:UDP-N-acetylglucosamine/UDP-N-acetylgalactosamine diphosphorylase